MPAARGVWWPGIGALQAVFRPPRRTVTGFSAAVVEKVPLSTVFHTAATPWDCQTRYDGNAVLFTKGVVR